MRKQTKVAAIVSAAALLVIGASMTSMASVKGTWMMVDGEWMCYDSDGDPYTDVFASSNGKDFYLGDDGYLVRSSWVDYDGDYYFVNSSGQKITNDWRLTVPYDDDEEEEQWFYFQSTGKMAASKRITYKGNNYYFDNDGKMLTGWVTYSDGTADKASGYDGSTYYCDENGARLSNAWVYDVEPGTDDDDADADEYWYYIGGGGKPTKGKKNNVKGQTYLFNDQAQMLYGWVADESGNDTDFTQLTSTDDDEAGTSIADYVEAHEGCNIYYCGGEDDGHVKKSKWVKTYDPGDADGDDGDLYWYWLDKSGRLYRAGNGSEETASGIKFKFDDGKLSANKKVTDKDYEIAVASKKVNSKYYWFNEKGQMLSKFYMIKENGDEDAVYNLYYFGGGDDGSMKTGSQTISDDSGDNYKFYFLTSGDKGAGVTGNKNNKLYYFGLLIQADDYKYAVANIYDEHFFIINTSGTIQHSASKYRDDGDDIIDAKDADFIPSGDFKYEIEDIEKVDYKSMYEIEVGDKVNWRLE